MPGRCSSLLSYLGSQVSFFCQGTNFTLQFPVLSGNEQHPLVDLDEYWEEQCLLLSTRFTVDKTGNGNDPCSSTRYPDVSLTQRYSLDNKYKLATEWLPT
ncbi:hypothetical protein Hypma_006672 [Hypsizygus marmoreus]|uniref:Uncharacterized protein n=1 Tax=Hypsizygus marmoreus TaxID=39966 RepID=A0A369JV24_HYPMA|nr:hypothetical protein Hypma_006672 [Hypsizygus marmoreus]